MASLRDSNLLVVYCTSTTAFNVRFILARAFASKALTRSPQFLFPALLVAFAMGKSAFLTKRYAKQFGFLHHFSCFGPFVSRIHFVLPQRLISAIPYSSLDAFWRDMLPVSRVSFCCIPLAAEPSVCFSRIGSSNH
jgi:hypothetical protein